MVAHWGHLYLGTQSLPALSSHSNTATVRSNQTVHETNPSNADPLCQIEDWQPSQAYYAFASAAGCDTKNAYLHHGSKAIFDCLVEADAATLMNASADVSQSGSWATWAFLPVTDGKFIQSVPSKQLARGNVNGLNQLSGHNALEGAAFMQWNISTVGDLVEYLQVTFPMLSNNDIAKILLYYPTNNGSVNSNDPTWATEGDSGPTTLNQSTAATGQKQRAIAIYGETTFICPSYWLAEAYSNNINRGKSWKYQFSIPNAYHGADGAGYVSWPYTGSYYSSDYVWIPNPLKTPRGIKNGLLLKLIVDPRLHADAWELHYQRQPVYSQYPRKRSVHG